MSIDSKRITLFVSKAFFKKGILRRLNETLFSYEKKLPSWSQKNKCHSRKINATYFRVVN